MKVWILAKTTDIDPTQILGTYTTAERGREWFTHHALTFDRIDKLTKGDNGAIRLEAGADSLELTAHETDDTMPARPTVTYRGDEHEVLWLGANHAGEPVVEIRSLQHSGPAFSVPVADLGDDYED